MFTPKTFPDILDTMASQVRASNHVLTDFNIGSVTRSWLEAGALALDELWMHTTHSIEEGIVEAVYYAHGFERLPSAHALGEVTFYLEGPSTESITIPAGVTVRKAGGLVDYITVETGLITAGELETTVMARAVASGPESNVDAGSLTNLTSTNLINVVGGSLFVTNRVSITNGQNEETDAERRERFADYIEALARGTVSAVIYGARLAYIEGEDGSIESVRHAALTETPGTVDLYIHNGARNTSQLLLDQVTSIIEGDADYESGVITPGWRAAGVEVRVHAMTDVLIDFEINAQLQPGYEIADVSNAAEAALDGMLRSFRGEFVSVPRVITTLYGVPGILDMEIVAHEEGIPIPPHARPVFSSLTINV